LSAVSVDSYVCHGLKPSHSQANFGNANSQEGGKIATQRNVTYEAVCRRAGNGSWVKWVTKIGWVTWVMGH